MQTHTFFYMSTLGTGLTRRSPLSHRFLCTPQHRQRTGRGEHTHTAPSTFGSRFCRHIINSIQHSRDWNKVLSGLSSNILFFSETTKKMMVENKASVIPLWEMFTAWRLEHKQGERRDMPGSDLITTTWKSTLKLQTWPQFHNKYHIY